MMVKLSDLRKDSWWMIEELLKAGGEPLPEHIIAALKRGEPVPARAQAYIAELLAGKRKKGRRSTPPGEHPLIYPVIKRARDISEEGELIMTVYQLAKQFSAKADPIQAAIDKIASARSVQPITVRRKFTKACARHPEAVEYAKYIK
jgi:hypothetical protein